MGGFLFGGNTGIRSPEELAQRRALARQAMARSTGETPQNVWQGLNSVAEAIGQRVERNRLDEAEAAGQKSAESAYAPIAQALANKQTPDAVAVTNALSNPWLNDGQRDVLKTYFKQQVGGDDPKFELDPIWDTDADGKTAVVNLPQDGSTPVQKRFRPIVTPSPGVRDTSIVGMDPKADKKVVEMPIDVKGKAVQDEIGTGRQVVNGYKIGQTARNPRTGEVVVWDGNGWRAQ